MIYGLYLSATGILTNAQRQDVITNNLANSETTAFKRDVPVFQERLTEAAAQRMAAARYTNPTLEGLGGGLAALPTHIDQAQGPMEDSANPLDVALIGRGFFRVMDDGKLRLTRDGRFLIDRTGHLTLQGGQRVLDQAGRPIVLDPRLSTQIDRDGSIKQDGQQVARLGIVDAADPRLLNKAGRNLYEYAGRVVAAKADVQAFMTERSNVDPATELTRLMESQRQLEANANMIRTQDQTLSRLVNEVGKIG